MEMENFDNIMNDEEIMVNDNADNMVETEEQTGIGTGVAMLIGAGAMVAVTAAVKLGKKAWAAIKAKKEASRKTDEGKTETVEAEVIEAEEEEVTE